MGEWVVIRDVCAVAQLVGALDSLSQYAYAMARNYEDGAVQSRRACLLLFSVIKPFLT